MTWARQIFRTLSGFEMLNFIVFLIDTCDPPKDRTQAPAVEPEIMVYYRQDQIITENT